VLGRPGDTGEAAEQGWSGPLCTDGAQAPQGRGAPRRSGPRLRGRMRGALPRAAAARSWSRTVGAAPRPRERRSRKLGVHHPCR
jgi:hypothetical protein